MIAQKKILLIEDEKVLAEMYERRFKKEGFEVVKSIDARSGIAIAKEEKPDLIILDIILPDADIDGIDVLKELKEDREIKDTPIILFSNYDTPEVREIAKEYNVPYVLKTDVTTKDLIKIMEREIGKKNKQV